jgi:aspartokinase
MVTISHIVKKMVHERPMLQETMRQGIISYGALAEKLKKPIESELGKKVKESAIIMALRRHSDELEEISDSKVSSLFGQDIVMKSGIADLAVVKSPSLASKLEKLYKIVDFDKGDILNLIHGNYEVSIIVNEKHIGAVLKVMQSEKVIMREKNLVAITMSISKEHLYTPGTLFTAVRKLAWDNVNIFELISTTTELIFIVSRKDSIRAYNSLQELIGNN